MKQAVQILKSKKIGLVIILITLSISNSISQTNPWENTTKENPWERTNKEEIKTTNTNSDSTAFKPVIKNQSTIKVDSLPKKVEVIQVNNSEQLTINKNTSLYLTAVELQSQKDYKAPAAFVGSFFTSGIFLIIGLPVSMITSIVPTLRADAYVMNYMNQNPKASKEEVKAVKKGIQKKRSLNSLGGSLAGMATGIIVWATLIFTN
ncbi:MAG: hypothetical protein RI883_1675 [Bacteroidota bacterium]|jgi:hypothetical protein